MRDRLIELIDYIREYPEKTCPHFNSRRRCKGCKYEELDDCASSRIADLLLESGVIVPPCKVGCCVWINTEYGTLRARVTEISLTLNSVYLVKLSYDLSYCYKKHINTCGCVGYTEDKFEFGKTVFHTKEEAEQALKGGGE